MTRTALADRDSDRWQIRTERAGPALGLGGAGGSDDPSQCRGRQRSRPSPTVNPASRCPSRMVPRHSGLPPGVAGRPRVAPSQADAVSALPVQLREGSPFGHIASARRASLSAMSPASKSSHGPWSRARRAHCGRSRFVMVTPAKGGRVRCVTCGPGPARSA